MNAEELEQQNVLTSQLVERTTLIEEVDLALRQATCTFPIQLHEVNAIVGRKAALMSEVQPLINNLCTIYSVAIRRGLQIRFIGSVVEPVEHE